MGKPIRIDDLARRMVGLSGFSVRDEKNPEGDIEIRYTGLRPAEKLFEELLIGNNVTGTEHPMIMRAMEHSLPWPDVERLLQQLLKAMGEFDVAKARELLKQGVSEYEPSNSPADLVWCIREARRQQQAKVMQLPDRRATGQREGPPARSN
jgi:FlaA1/EpsC-like NDP-sugar epimerase